jgi:hypothetical protein
MKRYLLPLLSVMLLLGLSTTGMAAITDATGDQFVAGKDLLSADALFYPASSFPVAEWVKLTVTMNTGSTLPGMLTWDFDVDGNSLTGGGSSLNMPFSPCPPTRCKTEKGFEFYVMLVLRDQSDTGNNAYAAGCVGSPSQCVTKGDSVSCTEGQCFEPGDACNAGDPGCFALEAAACTGSGNCPNAYKLAFPCVDTADCGTGLKYGEWYAGFGTGGNRKPILRGRLIGLGSIVNNKTQYCFTLPWGDIIAYASIAGAIDFNQVVNAPPYQLQIWHDPVYEHPAGDMEDFFDAGLLLNVADYVPNTGYGASVASAVEECLSDSNADCKVNVTDLVQIKSEFNRTNCPNCACTKP